MDKDKLQEAASGLLIAPASPVGDPFTNQAVFESAFQQLCPPGHEKFWRKSEEMVKATRPSSAYLFSIVRNLYEGGFAACDEGQFVTIRRLAFAVASDPIAGAGQRVNTLAQVESACSAKIIAAFTFIYSTAHRLAEYKNERHWRQVLTDALRCAEIGFLCAEAKGRTGDRGLLSGFAARLGLAWQIAAGNEVSAALVQEQLAAGSTQQDAARTVYGSDPRFVSALAMVCAGIPLQEVQIILEDRSFAGEIENILEEPGAEKSLRAVVQSGTSWPWLMP